MPYIAWNEQYELGIGQLDDHHRKLVELFNSTYRCCLEGNPESVVDDVVKELDNYVVYHFSAEERLMKAHDYPDQHIHTAKHKIFIRQVTRFKPTLHDCKATLAMEMVHFLGMWLIDHILDDDRKLCAYLTARGVS